MPANNMLSLRKTELKFIESLFEPHCSVQIPLGEESKLDDRTKYYIRLLETKRSNHIELPLSTILMTYVKTMQLNMCFLPERILPEYLILKNTKFAENIKNIYEITHGENASQNFVNVFEKTLTLSMLSSFHRESLLHELQQIYLVSAYLTEMSKSFIRNEGKASVSQLRADLKDSTLDANFDELEQSLTTFYNAVKSNYLMNTSPNRSVTLSSGIIAVFAFLSIHRFLSSYLASDATSLLLSLAIAYYINNLIVSNFSPRQVSGKTLDHYVKFLEFYNNRAPLNNRGTTKQVNSLLSSKNSHAIAKKSLALHFSALKQIHFKLVPTNILKEKIYKITYDENADNQIVDDKLEESYSRYNKAINNKQIVEPTKKPEDELSVDNNNNNNAQENALQLTSTQWDRGLLFVTGARKVFTYFGDYRQQIENIFTNNGVFEHPDHIIFGGILGPKGEFKGFKFFDSNNGEIKGGVGTGIRVYCHKVGDEKINNHIVPAFSPYKYKVGKN